MAHKRSRRTRLVLLLAQSVLVIAGCGAKEAEQRPTTDDNDSIERVSPEATETPSDGFGY